MTVIDLGEYGEEFTANPYPVYAELRAEGPAHLVRTRRGRRGVADRRARGGDGLRSPTPASPRTGGATTTGEYGELPVSANMLETDPPQHTRLRKLVAREFTPRRVEALRPRVQEVTDGLLDAMLAAPDRTADLVDSLAFPLPMTVICELLGVPDLDQRGLPRAVQRGRRAHCERRQEHLRARDGRVPGRADRGQALHSPRRRPDERPDPRTRRGRRPVVPDELIGMAFLLLVAGHETTVNLISNGVRTLLGHPGQLAALRADFDGLIDGAIEEILRYEGPVETATYRFTKRARPGRRRPHPGRRPRPDLSRLGRPRPTAPRRPGPLRHPPRPAEPPRLRPRHPLLPRRAARPHGGPDRGPQPPGTHPRPPTGNGRRPVGVASGHAHQGRTPPARVGDTGAGPVTHALRAAAARLRCSPRSTSEGHSSPYAPQAQTDHSDHCCGTE